MELHQGQVPAACVWAVVMDAPPGAKDVSWFITSEEATRDYTEVVTYIKTKTIMGTAERWLVPLPAQRMEADDVTIWVEGLLLHGDDTRGARRLDIYSRC